MDCATVVSVVTRQFGSLSIYLFMLPQNSLARTVFNTPKTCHMKLGAGAVLRWGRGGTGPSNVGQAPQIFWFQQQKYVFLKFRLFLYSGKINTRIS